MSDFGKATKTFIDAHEGLFNSRKDDPGNYTPSGEFKGTKYGISAKSYPHEDIENLSLARAEDLYRQTYGHFAVIEDQRVLTKVLDLAVNMQNGDIGPETLILQKALNACGFSVKEDAHFGVETENACNHCDSHVLISAICAEALAYYRRIEASRPEMKAWFKNWEGRAAWIPPTE